MLDMLEMTTPPLQHAVISGSATTGLRVTTRDGRPARLAVVDEAGNVIEQDAGAVAWNVALKAHQNYWIGEGHLTVHASPTGLVTEAPKGRARR